jgi:hypothetical protein
VAAEEEEEVAEEVEGEEEVAEKVAVEVAARHPSPLQTQSQHHTPPTKICPMDSRGLVSPLHLHTGARPFAS